MDTLPIRASILACPPPGTGCSKSLANVDAAVGIKKEAGKSTKLVLVRVEEVPKVVFDDNHSHISEPNMGDFRAGSRSDSVPSFNTNYGHSRPVVRVFESQISKYSHVRGLAGAKILVQVTNERINCKIYKKDLLKMFAEKHDCVRVFKAVISEYAHWILKRQVLLSLLRSQMEKNGKKPYEKNWGKKFKKKIN